MRGMLPPPTTRTKQKLKPTDPNLIFITKLCTKSKFKEFPLPFELILWYKYKQFTLNACAWHGRSTLLMYKIKGALST